MTAPSRLAKELAREYKWWFESVIEGAVEESAKEHKTQHERIAEVPGEGFKQYVDEHGNVFEVTINVEYQGTDY